MSRPFMTIMGILTRWLALTISVWVAEYFFKGIWCEKWQDLVAAALVLGILNSFVKPVLKLLSLPIILLSFGFFLLVINAAVLGLTAWLVEGFHVDGFWPAVGGSLMISVVSMFLGASGRRSARGTRTRRTAEPTPAEPEIRRGPPPGKGPIIDV